MLYRLYGTFTVSTQTTMKVSNFSWYKDHRVSPLRKTFVEAYAEAREEIKPAWNNVLAVGTIFPPILFKGLTFSSYFDFPFPRAKIVYNIEKSASIYIRNICGLWFPIAVKWPKRSDGQYAHMEHIQSYFIGSLRPDSWHIHIELTYGWLP